MRGDEKIYMVTEASATWASPREKLHDQISIDADHSAIVKFTDPDDPHYQMVEGRLQDCVKKAPALVKKRLATIGGGRTLTLSRASTAVG